MLLSNDIQRTVNTFDDRDPLHRKCTHITHLKSTGEYNL